MGNAASVSDNVKSLMLGFEVFIDLDLHIIELDLDAVKQSIVVCGAGCDLIECIKHFYNTVENTFGKNKAQIAGRCVERGRDKRLLDTLVVRALTANKIAEALNDNTAAEHIGKTSDAFAVSVGILKGLGKMLCNQKRKVGILRLLCGILIAVAVNGDDLTLSPYFSVRYIILLS